MATREEMLQALTAAHQAGDTENARRIATMIETAPAATQQDPLGVLGAAKGVGDLALAGARGTAHQLMGTAFGLGGAIQGVAGKMGVPGADPSMSYMGGKNLYDQGTQAGASVIQPATLTPEAQRVADWFSNIPIGFKGNDNQIARLGPTVQQLSENIGGGIENVAGPEARDLATSALTLATMKAPPAKLGGATAEAVGKAARAGYIVPPTTVLGNDIPLTGQIAAKVSGKPAIGEPVFLGSKLDRTARAWGGGSDVDARISMRNQQVTQQLAAESAKLPEMTPAAVQASATKASSVYDTIKSLKGPGGTPLIVPLNSQNFYTRVMALDKIPGFPNAPVSGGIAKLQHDLLTAHPNVENVVDRVRQLREDAFKSFDGDAEAQMLGRAQRDAADILDDELRDQLQHVAGTATNPNLRSIATRIFNEYTDARAQLSRLHNLRNVMNPSTGTIDAGKVARLRAQGYKIEPQLDEIANAHDAFGDVGMKTSEKAAKAAGSPFSHIAMTGALVGGNAGALSMGGKGAVMGSVIGALAIPFSQYAAREFALRGPGVRAISDMGGQGVRQAARAGVASQQIEDQQQ